MIIDVYLHKRKIYGSTDTIYPDHEVGQATSLSHMVLVLWKLHGTEVHSPIILKFVVLGTGAAMHWLVLLLEKLSVFLCVLLICQLTVKICRKIAATYDYHSRHDTETVMLE